MFMREQLWGPLHFWADHMDDAWTRAIAEKGGMTYHDLVGIRYGQPDLKKNWAKHFFRIYGRRGNFV
jgi:hypothetical protein